MNTHYSAFSLFRSYQQDTENSGLEVWDIKNDCVKIISYENFSEVSRVKNLLNSIQSTIKNSTENQEMNHGYCSWLKMGWHKAVDYYVASRATDDKNLFPLKNKNTVLKKTPTVDASITVGKEYDVVQALLRRRTKRKFNGERCLTDQIFFNGLFNALVLSDYELNGLEIYFIVYNVENITPGSYLFNIKNNALINRREGIFSQEMASNLQGMTTPTTASFTIILVANFEKLLKLMPYSKGLRHTYIESGRLAQKLLISYGQYGLSCLTTPALKDSAVSNLLNIDQLDYSPLYSLTFGYPLE